MPALLPTGCACVVSFGSSGSEGKYYSGKRSVLIVALVLAKTGLTAGVVDRPAPRITNSRMNGRIARRPTASATFTFATAAEMASCTPPLFQSMILRQLEAGTDLIRGVHPPPNGICISLRNNSVAGVATGNGTVHRWRAKQHIAFFTNLSAARLVPDSDININLNDFPVPGYFSFCRNPQWKGRHQFVLPTSRFTADDVFTPAGRVLPTYDDVVAALQASDRTFDKKEARAYLSATPHKSKWQFLQAAADTPDTIAVWAYIGPPHFDLQLPPKLKQRLVRLGMAGSAKRAFDEHYRYAYLLFPRGNTISDRLRLLLPLNAVILRDTSANFVDYQEFYYELLKPWIHYIPVTAGSLNATMSKLRAAPALCKHIIHSQHQFVSNVLSYARLQDYVQSLLWVLFPPRYKWQATQLCRQFQAVSRRRTSAQTAMGR